MIRWRILSAIVGCAAACAGCGDSANEIHDPPVREATPTATDNAGHDEPGDSDAALEPVTIRGFRFQVPAGWKQVALSPAQQGMIDARFEIPSAGPDVRLTLSTVGGGVEANVARWITQFTRGDEAAQSPETFEVDGVPVTWVDLSGTYHGMGGENQPDWRMLGAAFHGAPDDFYIKLTGPEAAVNELAGQFRTFVESARRE